MIRPIRTVICGLNSQYIHSSLSPWCLLAGVRAFADQTKIDAQVLEGTINEADDVLLERLLSTDGDVFGFSCYLWNIQTILRLSERLKTEKPRCVIVLGGPEVSYRAAVVLRTTASVDYVISGEGEEPFAALLAALCNGEDVSAIQGLTYRRNGEIVEGEPYLTDEVPPSPYCEEYFATLNGRIAYLETSRGCPFSCAFCLSGRCGNVRYYPMERAQQDIVLLAQSGAKTIKFVDRTFNANRKRALEIIRFILQEYGHAIPLGVCFHFEIAGDLLDEETITVLSEAPVGLFQAEIGVQSFHAETLEAVARRTDMQRLITNVKRLLACHTVHTHIDLIAGLPEETFAVFADSFNQAYALQPHMLQLGFLKLLSGSPMQGDPGRYPGRFSALPPYEVMCTPWITEEELRVLHGVETVLDRLYNSGRFRRTLQYLLSATQKTPFDLLHGLSQKLTADRVDLDAYTEEVYRVGCTLQGVDKEQLREHMACDRVVTNRSGILPRCLQSDEAQRKRLKRLADSDARFARPQSVKRGTAYVNGRLVYADYTEPHPVTGEYPLRYFTEECLSRQTQYLLFDLDGTLTDPALGITRAVQYALRHFGLEEQDEQKLLSYIGPPLLDTFRSYGLTEEQSREALRVYREYFADIGLYENEVYEGIPEFLKAAQQAGYVLIMATSKPEMYACRLMQYFGLTDYFSCIAGSDMAETRADKAAVIRYAMQRVGLTDVGQAVMIGDRKYDVQGARDFGMRSVAVMYGYGSQEELSASNPTFLVETVEELSQLFL